MNEPTTSSAIDVSSNPLPDLPPDEFDALKADIETRGLLSPVLFASDGVTVIDGHQRLRAWKGLGRSEYDIPSVILRTPPEQAREAGVVINTLRRHMTKEQRDEFIVTLRAMGMPVEEVAKVVQASKTTVSRVATPEAITNAEGEKPAISRPGNKPAGRQRAKGAGRPRKSVDPSRCTYRDQNGRLCDQNRMTDQNGVTRDVCAKHLREQEAPARGETLERLATRASAEREKEDSVEQARAALPLISTDEETFWSAVSHLSDAIGVYPLPTEEPRKTMRSGNLFALAMNALTMLDAADFQTMREERARDQFTAWAKKAGYRPDVFEAFFSPLSTPAYEVVPESEQQAVKASRKAVASLTPTRPRTEPDLHPREGASQ